MTGMMPPDVHVLLVEDDQDSREVMQAMLEVSGIRVTAVSRAEQALARLAGEPFDAVVTDLAMPSQSGFWLVGKIRDRFPLLPVLAVTGHPFPRAGVLRAGFDEHLQKPVDREVLCAALEHLVARTRAARRE